MREPCLISLAHAALAARLCPGDAVLDATCGQGFDTLFLARLVLPGGQVHAVDIQPAALEQSRALLTQAGFAQGLVFHGCSHDALDFSALPPLAAAVFNLGFLPGSNKQVITRPGSTLAALEKTLPRLCSGGLLCVHAYSGHDGAAEELEAVRQWAEKLSWRQAQVCACVQLNKQKRAETLFIITKC